MGLATGMNWADALSGGAEMGTENGPLLLVNPKAGVPARSRPVAEPGHRPGRPRARSSVERSRCPASVDKVVGGLIAGIGGVDYSSNPVG